MIRSKILVLGNFGCATPNGQTIKTRNIYDLIKLKMHSAEDIDCFDTERVKMDKLSLFEMAWKISRTKKLVYVPAQKSLDSLFPMLYAMSRITRFEILYLVVGGWLAEFLRARNLQVLFLSGIRGIFVESEQLCRKLQDQYRLENLRVFPNFRIHSFQPSFKEDRSSFRVVFMARITPMKGFEAVFRLAEYFDERYDRRHTMTIDFYGPIDRSDVEISFKRQVERFSFVSYKGILRADEVYGVLDQNDVVVLPTKYRTEGFPGTVLDAYISGIPVIVSRWDYAHEFVDEGVTGFIFDEHDEEKFHHDVEALYLDRQMLQTMKRNAYARSKLYSAENAWQTLSGYLSDA